MKWTYEDKITAIAYLWSAINMIENPRVRSAADESLDRIKAILEDYEKRLERFEQDNVHVIKIKEKKK